MQEPEPISALGQSPGTAVPVRLPGLVLEERAFVHKISIRGRAGDSGFASRFRDVLGVALPSPGTVAEGDAVTVLPAGLTEWLAVDRGRGSTVGLLERLTTARLIAVDVSCNATVIRACGPGLYSMMRKLATLPLDQMPVGSVARTRIGKLAILAHVLASDSIDLFVQRSFARSFFEQLQDAVDSGR